MESLKEAQIIVGEWVKQMAKGNPLRDNHVRPHSALGCWPPAPQTQGPQLMQNQPMLLQWFTMKKLSLVVDLNWGQFMLMAEFLKIFKFFPFCFTIF
jgi:hypothetical protein